MATLSSFDFWIPILAVLIVLLGVFGGFRARSAILVIAILIGLADGVIDDGLKHLVNRPRPTQVAPVRVVDLQRAKLRLLAIAKPPLVKVSHPDTAPTAGRSFPSGHTVNNFVLVVALIAFFGWRGLWFLPFAVGVAYSRIYTGSHWPSDVLASIFLGLGLGLLGVAISEGVWRILGKRFAPRAFAAHPSLVISRFSGGSTCAK